MDDSRRLLKLVRADIDAARDQFGSAVSHAFPNLFVALSHRVAHALERRGRRWSAHLVAIVCHVLTGAEIRPSATLGPGLRIVHPTGIVIGTEVVAGRNLALWGSNTLGYSRFTDPSLPQGWPTLGDDVIVLSHASVLGRVSVGDRTLVAAYALVLEDMPADSRPRGVPARVG